MQTEYIINSPGNSRLVIFFTGWSTARSIASLLELPQGYDLLINWDYRNLTPIKLGKRYEEVLVFAWSFGVPVAQRLYPELEKELNITGLYAINGSTHPIDNIYGIPEDIFNATITNLNESNLQKFRIRMAGGVRKYKALSEVLTTEMTIGQLKDELEQIRTFHLEEAEKPEWDCAFVSTNDKIFPIGNLEKSWRDTPIIRLDDEEHLPDFNKIFSRVIKDKETIKRKFTHSRVSYDETAIVQKSLCHNLIENLKAIKGAGYNSILELGSGTGYLSRLLYDAFLPEKFLLMDLSGECGMKEAGFISGDIEVKIDSVEREAFDLVVAGSTMQWFHSPSRIMAKVFSILKTGGIFALTTYLPDTFKEIREQTGSGLLYYSEPQWRLIAERAGFEILECISETVELKFVGVKEIFEHIKSTGVNSLSGQIKSVGEMRKLISNYPKKAGRYTLTYCPITLILRKNTLR